MYSLAGKVALVTGAQRGIGFATAQALVARGARVALADLDADATEAAAASLGGAALGIGADVTDRDRMAAVVGEVVEQFGGLDVVVANAGIAPPTQTVRASPEEVFERVIEVDLLGVYRTVKPSLPHVIERGGHVVVVASVMAFSNGVGGASYAMAKAGVEQFGRALRAELSVHGASATTAYFGFIDTEMVRESFDRNPLNEQVMGLVPPFLHKRLPPSAAGEGITRAIERRRARLILPKRWAAMSALRGVVNPLADAAMVRAKDFRALARKLDA